MQSSFTTEEVAAMRGMPVYSADGEEIGKVEEIFYDEETNRPEWIGIGTGFLGTKRVLVPLQGADRSGEALTVDYTKDRVKGAPDIDTDEISGETEQELYAYYGLGAADRETRDEDASITRAEEELKVGKRPVEAGRARLRKWVETEPVEMDVELRRETARVSREPIDQPVSDAELGEEEVEVPLREEEAVVQKQAVAKERVTVEKDVATERETIAEDVRKERVEVEGDAPETEPRRGRRQGR